MFLRAHQDLGRGWSHDNPCAFGRRLSARRNHLFAVERTLQIENLVIEDEQQVCATSPKKRC
jgi:hypothetical protein